MKITIDKKIKRIYQFYKKLGEAIPRGLTRNELKGFKELFKKKYNYELPSVLEDFYAKNHMLSHEGILIYSAIPLSVQEVPFYIFDLNDLIQEGVQIKDYIYIGDGSQQYYVINSSDGSGLELDRYSLSICNTFKSVEDLLEFILDQMIMKEDYFL